MDEVMPEVIQKELKTKKNPVERFGEYAITGGPGRGVGTLNRFTVFKNDLLKAAKSGKLLERVRAICETGSNSEVLEVARIIASLCPKELRAEIGNTGVPQIVFQFVRNERSEVIEIKPNNDQMIGKETTR